ncbi:hypothetical protein J2S43_004126 [Catenuloplanes nepalensis]|uniref:F5/8 type C domain-containing protein n=1 Tax=Catenuloplanes nepalensis TaxID=587533 RepID=A0ABT9MVZ4_9ACTN|nr:discoidin domain-containing protein [Catenuloplanes nepalensis]MDP9795614.1 hypothetical protein [Catenuloplanes nepalensis]
MAGPPAGHETTPGDDADRAGFASDRAHALRTMFPRRVAAVPDVLDAPAPDRADTPAAVEQTAAVPADAPPRKRGRRMPLLIGGALVVVAVAASAAVFVTANAATQADRTGVVVPVTTVEVQVPPDAALGVPPSPSATPPASPSAAPSAAPSASVTGTPSKKVPPAPAPAKPKGRANPSGANLALRRAVEVSGVEGAPWKASNAVDGDLSTRWSSAFTDPGWLTVDLGEAWAVTEVQVAWEHAYATAYRVEASEDGNAWTVLYRTASGSGGTVTVREPAVARYVRLYATQRNGQYGYSVLELRVR